MRGMEDAETITLAVLEARMPAKIAELVERLGLDPALLEPPQLYDRPQPRTVDTFPAVIVEGRETLAIVRDDITDGSVVYRLAYRVRVYVFVRGEETVDVATRRNRMMLAAREVLLGNQTFGGDAAARLDEATLRESYSDLVADENRRSLAAAFLEFDCTLEEVLTVPPIATANEITVTGDLLPVDG